MNSELTWLIDNEFSRIEKDTNKSFSTLTAQATYLKIDKAILSRLKNGARNITPRMAKKLATRLRDDQDARAIRELETQLVEAHPPASKDQIKVSNWFIERGKPGILMVVEFRELPAMRPANQKNPQDIARAIANGMSYALIFPFSLNEDMDSSTTDLAIYLKLLFQSTWETYKKILKEVLNVVSSQYEEDKKLQKLIEVAGRLKFYHLGNRVNNQCQAIGHRLFYIEDHTEQDPKCEHWNWISSDGQDLMIKKDSTAEELRLSQTKFSSIVEFWEENGGLLPQSEEDLNFYSNAIDDVFAEESNSNNKKPNWVPYKQKISTEMIVNKHLTSHKEENQND